MVEREGIRFIHLPVDKKQDKTRSGLCWTLLMKRNTIFLVILARDMQIYSDSLLVKKLHAAAINIPSFLSAFGFKGFA